MKPRSIKSPDIDPEQERKELQTLHWDTDAELFNLARNAAMKAGATGQDGQYTYQCPLPCCSRLFDRKYNLKVHMRKHTKVTPYACDRPNCTKVFAWRSSLGHHQKHHERKDRKERLAAQRRSQKMSKIRKGTPRQAATAKTKRSRPISTPLKKALADTTPTLLSSAPSQRRLPEAQVPIGTFTSMESAYPALSSVISTNNGSITGVTGTAQVKGPIPPMVFEKSIHLGSDTESCTSSVTFIPASASRESINDVLLAETDSPSVNTQSKIPTSPADLSPLNFSSTDPFDWEPDPTSTISSPLKNPWPSREAWPSSSSSGFFDPPEEDEGLPFPFLSLT